ncbi:MAG: glucosaminidase domain-containing protein [Crocinitomicaceae bacterium]|nr:glucosaminidase domain-containing protein [Crocinitomicaceae bacterium]
MKLFITSVGLLLVTYSFAGTATKITRQEYVDTWKAIAIEQMAIHNIPASITLAQGILESGSGNSELARKGNNHFGIKCHGWTGSTMKIDDDRKGECFRVYDSAKESYNDHSLFLNKYDRYSFLFDFDKTDYKAWAKGLKKAGYATNPSYPSLLIKIIEDLKLDQFDKIIAPEIIKSPNLVSTSTMMSNTHKVESHKKAKYVTAKKGDTFYKIALEFNLNLNQLYRYNDFGKEKDVLLEGDVVYIQRRRKIQFGSKK